MKKLRHLLLTLLCLQGIHYASGQTISGPLSLCASATATLTGSPAGGTWSSSTAVATIDPTTGVVAAATAGTAVITYTTTGGTATAIITVNPVPTAIVGTSTVCEGASVTLSNSTAGGTWSSGNPATATINAATGSITGVAAGTVTMSYTLSTGCYATMPVTVNAAPGAISGSSTVCEGSTATYTCSPGGGIWATSVTSVGTVTATPGSSTTFTGISAGTTLIIYISPGTSCVSFKSVTVNAFTPTIVGPSAICIGGSATLGATIAGGTWSSSGSAATISPTGMVTGVSAGTSIITYTATSGCGTASGTDTITVNAALPAISGGSVICIGTATTYTNATPGGTWSSSNPAIGTIDAATGILNPTAAGTTTVSYILTAGCIATKIVTVSALPVVPLSASVCVGSTATLTATPAGGTWISTGTPYATIDAATGVVTGVATGTALIYYLSSTGACISTSTVLVGATAGTITGPSAVCTGAAITLATAATGGTWSAGNANASVSAAGVVTGVSAGTVTITYAVTTACGPASATHIITVTGTPAAISGVSAVCELTTHVLSHPVAGGTWSSGATATGTIDASGNITGLTAGTVPITYTLPGGCFTVKLITVNPLPSAITGTAAICTGGSTTLTAAPAGGTWVSGSPTVGTISTAGVLTGLAPGTTTVAYILGTGCSTTLAVTVNAGGAGSISGSGAVCAGSSITLSGAVPGGTWTASNTNATVSAAGVVTGVNAGTVTITYLVSGSCGISTATTVITVNAIPAPISGVAAICIGASSPLTNTVPGGTWASSASSVATVGATSGILTGVSAGTANISYVLPGGCFTLLTATIHPMPAAIGGTGTVCVGNTLTLSSATSGGTWTSSAPATGTVTAATGIFTGIAAGTALVSYIMPTGCYSTIVVTVNPAPSAISGIAAICTGSTITLAATPGSGTWTSGTPATGTISAAGVFTALAAGTSSISYALPTGCSSTAVMTVSATPAAITGPGAVCSGSTITLSDATPGGTWSSTPTTVATIGATTGILTGAAAGTATVTYATGSCTAYHTVSVNALPAVTASAAAAACGNTWAATATGATSYTWSPATGLSCTGCANPTITPAATTVYTVTGTTAGCSATALVTVNGNLIYGHILFGGTTPASLAMKVWLIEYDATDSSITATDSVNTCLDGGNPYYQFSSKPAGNYRVKAKLLSSIAGTSDYVPTYGSFSPYWYAATTIAHTTASHNQDITMVYGLVPAGAGFISGYVYTGAGKGTATGAAGMLVYLKNTAGQVLTYTYTDGSGYYSFTGLGYGDYVIYPEDHSYYTTPSATITLSSGSPSLENVNFNQFTTSRVIVPGDLSSVVPVAQERGISIYPNPVSNTLHISWQGMQTGMAVITITDIAGRKVYDASLPVLSAAGSTRADVSALNPGIYFATITVNDITYTRKLVVQ